MRNLAIVAAWLGAPVLLVWLGGTLPTPLMWWTVLIATCAVGAIVDTWWPVFVPAVAAVIAVVILFIAPPACHEQCGDQSAAGGAALGLSLVTPALTVALAAGVAGRKFVRIARRELALERAVNGTWFGIRVPPRRRSSLRRWSRGQDA